MGKDSGALERLEALRLSCGDTVRAQLYLARARGDAVLEGQARALLGRLARDVLTVAVAGQFSRGKTTLLNALLGREYLPSGALPVTAVATLVQYAQQPGAYYRRRGGTTEVPVPLSEVPGLVARDGAARTRLQPVAVRIGLPAELLRLGVEFVDTPGLGTADAAASSEAFAALPRADAVMFVTSADSALNETDLALWERLPEAARVFIVVNKSDLAAPGEAARVAEAVRGEWSARRGGEADVFAVSALRALRGPAYSGDGGVPALAGRLASFLAQEGARTVLAGTVARAVVLAGRQRAWLDLAREYAAATPARRSEAGRAIGGARAAREAQLPPLLAGILSDAEGQAEAAWERDAPEWRRQAEGAVRGDGAPWAAWASSQAGLAADAAARSAAARLPDLAQTAGAPARAALRWADDGPADGRSAEEQWEVSALPPFPSPGLRSPAGGGRAHGKAGSRRGRGDWAAQLAVAQQQAIVGALGQWSAALARQAGQRAVEADARLDAYLARPPSAEDEEALARVARCLAEATEAIGRSSRPAGGPAQPAGAAAPGIGPTRCPVCAAQRRVLEDDLARRAFALATREADQDELARTHGLCRSHAWALSASSSTLGEAAAYAPVAAAVSSALAGEAGEAASLLCGPELCPVCRAVETAGRAAVAELAAGLPDTAVCLPHLAQAAAAGLPDRVLAGLADRLTALLARDSRGMRSYALKREALARSLASPHERAASQEALRLLAGDPLLASPAAGRSDEI